MRMATAASMIVLALLLCACVCSSEVTCDHFNYGTEFLPLTGLGGGENWGAAWAGYHNLSPAYHPDAGLSYSGGCYTNDENCNDPAHGGTVHQSYRGAPRAFPCALTDVVWVSTLVRLGPNENFRGFTFSSNELTFGFGINSDRRAYIYFAGCDTVEASTEHSIDDVHLVVARVEIDVGASDLEHVSVWIDPEDTCSGEAGLGVPDVALGECDVADDWDTLMFELGNGSNLDAIRISHGPDGCLEEVLCCPIVNAAEASTWGRMKALYR